MRTDNFNKIQLLTIHLLLSKEISWINSVDFTKKRGVRRQNFFLVVLINATNPRMLNEQVYGNTSHRSNILS